MVKLVYPDVNCPQGYIPASESACRAQTVYIFQSVLTNDADWIDGCFEWYANRNGQAQNSKKLYYNMRAGATTGNYGGNRICVKAAMLQGGPGLQEVPLLHRPHLVVILGLLVRTLRS